MKTTTIAENQSFSTYLKNWCAEQKPCKIAYRQNNGETIHVSSTIVDLFSWQGKDYLLMEKGQLISLERLLSVNDTAATVVSTGIIDA